MNSQSQTRNRTLNLASLVLGRVIQLFALLGLVLALAAALALPSRLNSSLDRLSSQIEALSDQLVGVDSVIQLTAAALEQVVVSLESTRQTLLVVEQGVADFDPLLHSIRQLLQESAPETIEAAHAAILSTQEGARAIDGVLRALGKVSWLTQITYDPTQSLDESLAEVADSLTPLPESLREVGADLVEVQNRLGELEPSLAAVNQDLDALQNELVATANALRDGSETIVALGEPFNDLSETIITWKPYVNVVFVFLSLNFAFIQVVVWVSAQKYFVDLVE